MLTINTIEDVLSSVVSMYEASAPQTKKEARTLEISGVHPENILVFMEENKVPLKDAWFSGCSESDAPSDAVYVKWSVKVPTTSADRENYIRRKVNSNATLLVGMALQELGYSRVNVASSAFKPFDDTSVYDMFTTGEWQRLEQYYLLSFKKI